MKEQPKTRVLQVNIDNNGGNGAFSLACYLYEKMNDEFIFDFYTMDKFAESKELVRLENTGSRLFSANLRTVRLLGHIVLPFAFYIFLLKHKYEVIHIHSEVAYKHFLYALPAKLAHTKKIIIHSHSNNVDGDKRFLKRVFHYLFKPAICSLGTEFIAISTSTAQWMYTKKIITGKHFHIITNGINPQKYIYDERTRNIIRHDFKLNISDVAIVHVGALKMVKNQRFLIRLLKICNDKEKRYKLFLVGDGPDRQALENLANNLGEEDNVFFLGARDDVNKILQGMDIFCFPSIYEGAPMSMIEAQTVGLPIIASDQIQTDIKVNSNVLFLPIGETFECWKNAIEEMTNNHLRIEGYINISKSKYNIENSAYKLAAIYEGINED